MGEEDREVLTEKSATLRSDLKAWEKEFAAQNDGRKAGREDIKQNPAIGIPTPPYLVVLSDIWDR